MPAPRRPNGPDPFAELKSDEMTAAMVEGDIALDFHASIGWAAAAVHHWMPVVQSILTESEKLLAINPSASVVWSVQALEVFLKKAVLGPALRARLGFDPELTEAIFKTLLGHNGPKAAKDWLNRLVGLSQEYAMNSSLAGLWSVLFGEHGITDWRNKIVHEGEVASVEEAEKSLKAVREFMGHVSRYLEDFRT